MDALAATFGEEGPKDGAGQEVDWVVRDVAAEAEEFREDDVENCKHEQGAKKRPEIAEDGTLVAEFEVGFGEFFQKDAVTFVPNFRYVHTTYYSISQRLML